MIGLGLAAAEVFLLFLFRIVEELACICHNYGEAAGQELLTQLAQVIIPSQRSAKTGRSASVRIEHGFQILQMAGGSAGPGFRQHFPSVAVRGGTKFAESSKEMVVAGFNAGHKLAHGKRVE